ncbi:PRC and DUF2382 domain-containing protein [Streptomyces somaliensis DSM 40738]|uniref:PRC and DUF2382 domain-containing protein n=1 Tax=Streptomyces somaliensis (strain ATCC 33201 / DSM 40738 / JCM 12659 / KCTC 9044 / NCTC 11332 / NRRL B-12077 / IP 733) TaxID=1134445 RepID=A0AA44DGG3_STRE0|nr:PRC and DUF2382 domain-containing protein [Streptomyces somaliensis]MCQ0024864.1 PRC and DUF2382 domain-containing protein [Streptomyces somaliensis DSM 40738]NKY16453.1 PRC and DUF2382 domain-containing protein [Streptomyces somaliensis DSM 40738]
MAHNERAFPVEGLQGETAYDSNGEKIGTIGQVYVDDRLGTPEWVTVRTGMFGTKETFVPLAGARRRGGELHVPYVKDMIKDAPRIDVDEHLDAAEEQRLYRHYQLTPGGAAGTAGTAGTTAGGMASGRAHQGRQPAAAMRSGAGDEGLTRSEEQVQVGTEQYEAGRARLRKYVVTEDVTTTVPVSHEEVRVVREPIRPGERAAPMEDTEQEVTLHAERPTVSKKSVPVERVRLETEKVTEQQDVTEQVRKEKIEYDDDRSGRGRGTERGRGPKHGPNR